MVVISALSNIPNLVLLGEDKIPPEVIIWAKQYSVTIGTEGFFSYEINLHPDYILHKLGHIVMFGILGVALYCATKQSLVRTVLFVFIFALADELHQGYVSGRSSRLGDVILDVSAAILFCLMLKGRKRWGG